MKKQEIAVRNSIKKMEQANKSVCQAADSLQKTAKEALEKLKKWGSYEPHWVKRGDDFILI